MPPAETPEFIHALTRRTLLGGSAAALTAYATASTPARAEDVSSGSGHWLGEQFWGNRLQDWLIRDGRMECVAERAMRVGRTVAVLTHEISGPTFELSVRTGVLELGAGLSGFVIGTGVPEEDPRRRALLGSASGTGGGLIACVDDQGRTGFRDHESEADQFRWASMPSADEGTAVRRQLGEDLTLRLVCRPAGPESVELTLSVSDTGGAVRHRSTLADVPWARVRGGVALMSSSRDGSAARYWFTGLAVSGVSVVPERRFGPVAGTLFSIAGGILRMTVQLMPLDPRHLSRVSLEIGRDGRWRRVGTAPVGPGYSALFYVRGVDTATLSNYRVIGGGRVLYGGTLPATPLGGLRIASLSCVKASHRPLDSPSAWAPRLDGGLSLDLYSRRNVYFPHDDLVASVTAQNPDLLVAHGDQIYETSPTRKDSGAAPELDFLYKFLMWHWSMRSLTRRLPIIVLTDDHDVYQGNLFGEGGIATGDQYQGGYVKDAAWVNLVQRVSSWHNPDRYDPTPIARGITVGYAAFSYGGTSFAIVEDRKFKTGPVQPGGGELQLLGGRQEAFLAAWARMHAGQPKVLLTATTWACVQTTVDGHPRQDPDSNGWPASGRARAVQLARDAHALILAGDQHVGHLVRHGISGFTDGPLQFTPPAGSASFQRWFEPAADLPNGTGTPHTGDFTDAFGNRLRVLAVANPKVTFAQFWEHYTPPSQALGDRSLKREGFGLIALDHQARTVRLECWPWHAAASGAEQYAGWPVTAAYDTL